MMNHSFSFSWNR